MSQSRARGRLPRLLRVGHTTWTIAPDEVACDESDADGFIEAAARRVAYRPGLSPDRRREVLVHEVLHAAIESARGHGLDDDAEERVVDALTGPVLDLIRRNPELIAFLQQ